MATKAATKGRLTKRELKQDKLVELTYQVEHYYLTHKNTVIGIAAAILIIIVGGVLVTRMMKTAKLEQSYELTIAKTAYGTGNLTQAKEGFQRVLSQRGGSAAGEAQYFLGRIALEQGDFQAASTAFETYIKEYKVDKYIDAAAAAGLAATREALGQPEDAAKLYEEVAREYPDLPYAPQALMDAQRVYLKLNQNDKAIAALKLIREKYPESTLAAQAKRVLDTLQ